MEWTSRGKESKEDVRLIQHITCNCEILYHGNDMPTFKKGYYTHKAVFKQSNHTKFGKNLTLKKKLVKMTLNYVESKNY